MSILWVVTMAVHPRSQCNKHHFTAPSVCDTSCHGLMRLTMDYNVIKYLTSLVEVDSIAGVSETHILFQVSDLMCAS